MKSLLPLCGIAIAGGLSWQIAMAADISTLLPRFSQSPDSTELSNTTEPLIPEDLTISDTPEGDSRVVRGRDDRQEVRMRAYPWTAIGNWRL